jgi:hypothetical protein
VFWLELLLEPQQPSALVHSTGAPYLVAPSCQRVTLRKKSAAAGCGRKTDTSMPVIPPNAAGCLGAQNTALGVGKKFASLRVTRQCALALRVGTNARTTMLPSPGLTSEMVNPKCVVLSVSGPSSAKARFDENKRVATSVTTKQSRLLELFILGSPSFLHTVSMSCGGTSLSYAKRALFLRCTRLYTRIGAAARTIDFVCGAATCATNKLSDDPSSVRGTRRT